MLRHVADEAKSPFGSARWSISGDAMEGRHRQAGSDRGAKLALRKVPCFMFHEGHDPAAANGVSENRPSHRGAECPASIRIAAAELAGPLLRAVANLCHRRPSGSQGRQAGPRLQPWLLGQNGGRRDRRKGKPGNKGSQALMRPIAGVFRWTSDFLAGGFFLRPLGQCFGRAAIRRHSSLTRLPAMMGAVRLIMTLIGRRWPRRLPLLAFLG